MPLNETVAVPTTSRLMVLSPNDVAFALNGGKKANTIDMGRTKFRGCYVRTNKTKCTGIG